MRNSKANKETSESIRTWGREYVAARGRAIDRSECNAASGKKLETAALADELLRAGANELEGNIADEEDNRGPSLLSKAAREMGALCVLSR